MVAQVFADARQLVDHFDAVRLKMPRLSYSRKLQQFGRIDRAAAYNDLAACAGLLGRALPVVAYADAFFFSP